MKKWLAYGCIALLVFHVAVLSFTLTYSQERTTEAGCLGSFCVGSSLMDHPSDSVHGGPFFVGYEELGTRILIEDFDDVIDLVPTPNYISVTQCSTLTCSTTALSLVDGKISKVIVWTNGRLVPDF